MSTKKLDCRCRQGGEKNRRYSLEWSLGILRSWLARRLQRLQVVRRERLRSPGFWPLEQIDKHLIMLFSTAERTVAFVDKHSGRNCVSVGGWRVFQLELRIIALTTTGRRADEQTVPRFGFKKQVLKHKNPFLVEVLHGFRISGLWNYGSDRIKTIKLIKKVENPNANATKTSSKHKKHIARSNRNAKSCSNVRR